MKTELYKAFQSINGEALSDEEKDELLRFFIVTKSALIRDQLAMIFADVGYNKAVPYILKKIKDRELYNNNGTLVAALRGLDAKKYFNEFVKILCTQDYEARLWALDLIEESVDMVSSKVKKRAVQTLMSYKKLRKEISEDEYPNSTLHFIEEAISLIDESLNS